MPEQGKTMSVPDPRIVEATSSHIGASPLMPYHDDIQCRKSPGHVVEGK